VRRRHYVELVEENEDPGIDHEESPIEAFLEQPAYHADEDAVDDAQPSKTTTPAAQPRRGFRRWFSHFMFDKEPSQYSSIAPRTADGKRTKIFFFNGNGRGR
jgi:hypothetical protein